MLHNVEVDQSGKVEDTKEDTVLAFANGIEFSVLIPATVKRECIHLSRAKGVSGDTFYLQFFAIGLFFLLRNHLHCLSRVRIDIEYVGQDGRIKEYLINLLRRAGYTVKAEQIQFAHIGKQSPADTVAWSTLRKRKKPNYILSFAEILGEFRPLKKSGTT
jgi:hypothetical protein